MDSKLRELIDERFFGMKKKSSEEIVKISERERVKRNVRNMDEYWKKRDKFWKEYDSFGSKMRRLLVNDGEMGWSWRAWFESLLNRCLYGRKY